MAVITLTVGALTLGFAGARKANLEADHALRGYYEVVDTKHEEGAPLGWVEVGIDSKGRMTVWKAGREAEYFNTRVDPGNHMVLRPRPNGYESGDRSLEPVGRLEFAWASGALHLEGPLQGDKISIELRPLRREWHLLHPTLWVHEYVPYR